jgi:hypothetical protein
MTEKGSFTVVALGLSGAALIAVVFAAVARRTFFGRIECLQRSVEQTRTPSHPRTDLPSQVQALALRLGVQAGSNGRIVQLTQSGEM